MTAQTFTATTASRRRIVAVAASAALPFVGLIALAGPAGATGNHNPPGNNGTIKVDGLAFDTGHPNNEPHVDCKFEIDFYGFDKGNLYAQVAFNAQPPTGKGEQLLTDKVFIGEDDKSGGGSQAGLDAHKEYDLSKALAAITPHPEQGYHVKLTINADGSQGADVKHKVFWVDGCRPTTPDIPKDTPGGTPGTPGGDNGTPAGKPADKPEVKPETKTGSKIETKPETKTETKTEVKGKTLARPDAELPHTGVETLPLAGLGLAGLGLALLGAGQAARMAVRRSVR
jgi:hypothetical protein